MAHPAIASPVLSDAAALTAGNELGSLPAANLLTQPLTAKWRTASLVNTWVEADLGAARTINLVALLGTNASAAATWRIRGATSQANLIAAPGFDTVSETAWPETGLDDWPQVHLLRWITTTETWRWWRLDVSDAGNGDGYVQAGRLYIAAAWQPTRNLQFGNRIGWADTGETDETDGGQIVTTEKPARRTLEFELDFIGEDEMFDNGFELDRRRGTGRDVLVLMDPASASHLHKKTIYGLLRGRRPIRQTMFGRFQKSFRLEELI